MNRLTLVGRFLGKTVSIRLVNKWAQDCWAAMIGESPEVEGLVRGWYAFNFVNEEHLI